MKQSTFSAVMANSIKNLLQGYTKGIRITAILILLLMGVNNAWAGVQGGEIYFDAYTSKWTSNLSTVEYVISHDSYSKWFKMANISNTQLYYISSESWGDAKYIAFTANFGWTSGEGNSYDHRKKYGPSGSWYTAKSTYGVNSGSTYLFYAASASNDAAITTTSPAGYLGNGKTYTALNYKQTINTVVDGTVANSKATISITSYKMTGKQTATKQEATLGTSAKDSYIDAARTATTTLTVGTVATGYQFDGWYTAATGGTQLSTDETYTYYPTAATTVYARFSAKKYTVTLNANGGTGGTASVTATYGQAMPSATMPTREGYTFKGYFDATSDGTKYYDEYGTSAKNWDKTSATTLYAQWTIKSYSVTWVVDGVELTGAQLDGVTTNVNHSDKIATAPKVVVEDYCGDIFVGWTDAVGGEYVHGTSNLYTTDFPQITNHTTLYAVFADYKK